MKVPLIEASIVVAGCGNIFYGDDGFGVHVIKALKNTCNEISPSVRIVDSGTGGPQLVNLLSSFDISPTLILIDAARLGNPIGTVSVMEYIPSFSKMLAISCHGMCLGDELDSYKGACHMVLFEPFDTTYGSSLSHYALDATNKACECVYGLIGGRRQ